MKFAFICILISWFLGPHSKIYYCLACIPVIIALRTIWPIGIVVGIVNLSIVPKVIAKVKANVQPKINRLLDDVHTLAEEARKKEP